MNIVIIDYGSGNLRSVVNAFLESIKNNNLNYKLLLTNDIKIINSADYIVLPGVGAFKDCMDRLSQIDDLIKVLEYKVLSEKKPFLGICVGMQMLAEHGLEKKKSKGLGWLKGIVEEIKIDTKDYLDRNFKIPHMGWNNLKVEFDKHPVLKNIDDNDQFYFIHSFYFKSLLKTDIIATTNYGIDIPSVIGKENFMGVQFHPEKSSISGQKIITNWLNWKP